MKKRREIRYLVTVLYTGLSGFRQFRDGGVTTRVWRLFLAVRHTQLRQQRRQNARRDARTEEGTDCHEPRCQQRDIHLTSYDFVRSYPTIHNAVKPRSYFGEVELLHFPNIVDSNFLKNYPEPTRTSSTFEQGGKCSSYPSSLYHRFQSSRSTTLDEVIRS